MSTNWGGTFKKLLEEVSDSWLMLPIHVRGIGCELLRVASHTTGRLGDTRATLPLLRKLGCDRSEAPMVEEAVTALLEQGFLSICSDGGLYVTNLGTSRDGQRAKWRELKTNQRSNTPLSTDVHPCPPMSTDVHEDTPLSTDVHPCPPMSTDVLEDTSMSTRVHSCPPMSTDVHRCPPLYIDIDVDQIIPDQIRSGTPITPPSPPPSPVQGLGGLRLALTGDIDGGQSSEPAKPRHRKRERQSLTTNPQHQPLVAHYFSEFQRLRGEKPPFSGREAKAAEKILESFGNDLEKSKRVITHGLSAQLGNPQTILSIANDPAKWLSPPPIPFVPKSRHGPVQPNCGTYEAPLDDIFGM